MEAVSVDYWEAIRAVFALLLAVFLIGLVTSIVREKRKLRYQRREWLKTAARESVARYGESGDVAGALQFFAGATGLEIGFAVNPWQTTKNYLTFDQHGRSRGIRYARGSGTA